MALPNLPVPEFPDVPALPGVPALLRSATVQVGASLNGLLVAAGLGQLALSIAKPVWGVFDAYGYAIAVADSVRTLQYHGESRISDYPQEEGAFESYNKVQLPYAAVVSLACGGDVQRRASFLAAVEGAKLSTDLYSIVTPEMVYPNANIVAYDYRRTQRDGATLLTVDLHIEEVRVNATASFANVQNAASADPSSQGQVQAQTPTASQSTLFGPVSAVQGMGGLT